jgi:hypothetical protein
MGQRGRPRLDRELEKAGKFDSEQNKKVLAGIARKLGTSKIRQEAAKSIRSEGSGQAIWECRFRLLRNTEWARGIDPDRKMGDLDLFERFRDDPDLSAQTRCEIARQMGLPAKEVQELSETAWRSQTHEFDQQDDALLKRNVRIERQCLSLMNRSVTPYVPAADELIRFRKIGVDDPRTWPTLTDLKLATAFSEKKLRTIIANSRPQTSEITAPLRSKTQRLRISKRGALPNRYHPRLVLIVLEEFLKRLRDLPISNAEQQTFRETAMTVKRALTFKLSRSVQAVRPDQRAKFDLLSTCWFPTRQRVNMKGCARDYFSQPTGADAIACCA